MTENQTTQQKNKNKKPWNKNKPKKEGFTPKFKGDNPNLAPLDMSVRNEPNYQPINVDNQDANKFRDYQNSKKEEKKENKPAKPNQNQNNKEKAPELVPSHQIVQEVQALPLESKVSDLFDMYSDKSCRGQIYLNTSIAQNMIQSFYHYVVKRPYILSDPENSLLFEAAGTVAAVGQIMASQPDNVRDQASGLGKLTKVEMMLPSFLCGIIKSLGNFTGEYGKIVIAYPVSTSLSIISKLYRKVDPEYVIDLFVNSTDKTVFLPWDKEGFAFVNKLVASEVLKTGASFSGRTANIPLPGKKVKKADFFNLINNWPGGVGQQNSTLLSYLFLAETGYVKTVTIAGTEIRFMDPASLKKVKKWCNALVTEYQDILQADVMKIFHCDKFVTSTMGTYSQFVSRDGKVLTSPFMVGRHDAAMGAFFNYCEKFELVGDFSSYVSVDMYLQGVKMIQNGLKRLETIS